MNFLVRNSAHMNAAAPDAQAPTPTAADKDQTPIVHSVSVNSLPQLPSLDSGMGDDFKGAGEFGSIWTRMPIEDHWDSPPDEGSIIVPFRVCLTQFSTFGLVFGDLPENWSSAPDVTSLKILDRDFIFPGEQFHILVHVRGEDTSGPEISTPFKVAGHVKKLAAKKVKQTFGGGAEGDRDSDVRHVPKYGKALAEEVRNIGGDLTSGQLSGSSKWSPAIYSSDSASCPTTSPQQEAKATRTAKLLDCFRKSHYYVRIISDDDPRWKMRVVGAGGLAPTGLKGGSSNEHTKAGSYGCTPVSVEGGRFDPRSAGGIARRAIACSTLDSGDIVVLLQVTMAEDCILDDASLEVLQFERFEFFGSDSLSDSLAQQQSKRFSWDPTEGLLQWLLPLDRPSSPPPSVVGTIQASPKLYLTATNSNIFSFGHLRSSSTGSMPALQAQHVHSSTATHAPPTYGSKVWDSVLQERNKRGEPGSEGLLSFRGADLEPQRFAANCGLEGSHVPGKRWRRKLSIVQPIKLESYFAHCNTQDLICVLVEHVLPPTGKTADVVLFVDSVNIICQSPDSGSPPLSVPISCVEVGNEQELPCLSLRAGEQHSFILRPTSPAWKASPVDANMHGSAVLVRGQYAVVVSCHCSHTESRLHYKHPLQWLPRLPRDLLVSVSLESSPPVGAVKESQPVFKSQVVTVQATNLTSQDMNLTLLAPSTLANSPLSMVTFPAPLSESPITGYGHHHSLTLDGEHASGNEEDNKPPSTVDQKPTSHSESLSLPPVQSIESVIGISPVLFRERNVSVADIAAENSPARTHLWLQSVVPLGCVPAFSTTAVKCDILPLTDGIITLDTLHLSTNEHDALYIPESPLQICTTSSIATGVA